MNYARSAGHTETGNVLFLILIAVALFAALSYAVTQTTRNEAGSSDNETALINSSQLIQYPTSVRASILRMMLGGVPIENLEFNSPSQFDTLTSPSVGVFHPNGGGATFIQAPVGFIDPNFTMVPPVWKYTGSMEVKNIGTSSPGSFDGNELIMWIFGLDATLCNKINEEIGITADGSTAALFSNLIIDYNNDYTPGPENIVIGDATFGTEEFDGVPYGCLKVSPTGVFNIYYHVIVER